MNNYFQVIDDLAAAAIAEPFINSVSQGDITEIDLNKSTIYPLCHLSINNATLTPNINTVDVSIILMDIVDFSKKPDSSDIRGNNNEMDVLNTMLTVAGRLQALLVRTESLYNKYQLDGPFNCEPFTDRFDNNVAGFAVSFTISLANTSTSAT